MLKLLPNFIAAILSTGLVSHSVLAQPTVINLVYDLRGVAMTNQQPTPGFGEQLQIQLLDPRVRIHFFGEDSAAGIERLLARIRLPDGSTAGQVARIIDGSKMGNLDPVAGGDAGEKYKDLRVITTDPTELANTVLIDTSDFNAHPDQTTNLFWLPPDLGLIGDKKTKTPAPSTATPKPARQIFPAFFRRPSQRIDYVPPPEPVRRAVNHRSDLMLGLIRTAQDMADQNNESVSSAIHQLQWSPSVQRPGTAVDFRLDDPEVQAELITYGARVRKDAACALSLTALQK